ncbi:hypothetical protein [Viridibacillus arvi]
MRIYNDKTSIFIHDLFIKDDGATLLQILLNLYYDRLLTKVYKTTHKQCS